jgi:hypothetical protein
MKLFSPPIRLFLLYSISVVLLLSACRKDQGESTTEEQKTARLSKIIDWEAATFDKDTVPEYDVVYSDGRITSLIGKYNDTLHFKYEYNIGIYGSVSNYLSGSRIIRTRNFSSYTPAGLDTIDFKSDSFEVVQAVILGAVSPMYNNRSQYVFIQGTDNALERNFFGTGYDAFTSNIRVVYDDDGDPTQIEYKTAYEANTFDYKVEVTYSDKENTLHQIADNISLYDPSCRSIDAFLMANLHPYSNIFPFSIHYGKKCVSSFAINGGNPHAVSYALNDEGYITKILIDNQPFKEFLYANN